jgi:hypothetical protein
MHEWEGNKFIYDSGGKARRKNTNGKAQMKVGG